MLSIAAKEWMAEGEARGEAKGEARGKERVLRQLRRRFPTLPPSIEDRVRAATSDQLDAWSDLILDAREVSDVFGADWQH